MEFIQQFMKEQGAGVVSGLVSKLGISSEQSEQFLPAAVQKILDAVKSGGFDLGALAGGGGISSLIAKIDTAGLASEVGVDEAKASAGIEAVAPPLLASLKEKAGGVGDILSMLGSETGGLLSGAGKFAGKLFK